MSFFPQTSWTVIANAGRASTLDLEQFCRDYRQPIYSFARSKGLSHEDAEDLTQTFFISFIKRSLLEQADPTRGRLRNYLLKHLSFVLRDYFKFRNAVSRGGRVEFVPMSTTFSEVSGAVDNERPLVSEDTLQEVINVLQRTYDEGQPDIPFAAIRPFLVYAETTERPNYEDLLRKYPHVSAPALRKRVSRLRNELKKLLIARVPELKHYAIKPRPDAQSRFDLISSQGEISPETVFNREWATRVLENARRELRREYNQKYSDLPFKAFDSVFRGEDLDGEAIRTQFAVRLSDDELERRARYLRQRLVELRNGIVASTVSSESEVAEEVRALDECWLSPSP